MNDIINHGIATYAGLTIPDDTTQEGWADIHRSILTCKRAANKWLSQSRKWGTDRWGIDFVADTEIQLELSLGIEMKEKPASLNPPDKSGGIVTIEGIAGKFGMWIRKMQPEIDTWDNDRITRALALLEPIEAQAKALRDRLGQ